MPTTLQFWSVATTSLWRPGTAGVSAWYQLNDTYHHDAVAAAAALWDDVSNLTMVELPDNPGLAFAAQSFIREYVTIGGVQLWQSAAYFQTNLSNTWTRIGLGMFPDPSPGDN